MIRGEENIRTMKTDATKSHLKRPLEDEYRKHFTPSPQADDENSSLAQPSGLPDDPSITVYTIGGEIIPGDETPAHARLG